MLTGVRVLVITSGHEVTDSRVYAREARSIQELGAAVTLVGKLERGNVEGARVIRVPVPASRPVRFLWQPWRCLWKARREKADIVHFHDAEMLATLPLAKLWWPKSRFVYDVHEDFPNLMLVRDWLPALAKPTVRFIMAKVEKVLASLADGIVGVTPPLAARFSHAVKAVVYNFVPDEFFARAEEWSREPRSREFDLVHLGTLSSRRALFLAEVLTGLHSLRKSARSIVIGVSPDILNLLKGRVPRNCTVMGKVPYSEIPDLLGNARIGLDVHPWLGPHLEVAMPVKVCEYMAAGCGVVSSSMPVLNDVLKRGGTEAEAATLIEGGAPADYVLAISKMLKAIDAGENPGLRLQAVARREMNWDTESKKLAQFYLRLLGRPCAA